MRESVVFYTLLGAYAVVDVCANLCLKRWLDGVARPWAWFFGAMLLYVGCGAAWAVSLRWKAFHKAQLVYSPVALLCGIAIVILAGDRAEMTWRAWLGAAFALAAIVLVETA